MAHRLNGERAVLFGWSRAILLQLAHPLIAAGVAHHSSFRRGPLIAAARLHHTVRAMLALTFGTEAKRDAALAGIMAIHRRVHGTLEESVGPFPAGTPYSAEDSELVVWVHVTLLESIPMTYDRLVAPLSEDERDRYCLDAAPIALALGARDADVPRSWRAVERAVADMHEGGRIAVGGHARRLAAAVLAPPFARMVAPLASLNRLVTVGLLPQAVRDQYGFTWSARDQEALERWSGRIRRVRRSLPDALALWPEARG